MAKPLIFYQQPPRVSAGLVRARQEHREEDLQRAPPARRSVRPGRQVSVHEDGPRAAHVRRDVLPGQGEDDRQEQAGSAAARRHQELGAPAGRAHQGDPEDVAADDGAAVGRFAEHVHAGLWRLRRPVLLGADDGGRADRAADCRLHRHHPEEEASQGSLWHRRRRGVDHGGGERGAVKVSGFCCVEFEFILIKFVFIRKGPPSCSTRRRPDRARLRPSRLPNRP